MIDDPPTAVDPAVYPRPVLDELLTTAELAAYLKVPVQTIHAWRTHGTGPIGVRMGKHVRYPRRDVEQWISDRTASVRTRTRVDAA